MTGNKAPISEDLKLQAYIVNAPAPAALRAVLNSFEGRELNKVAYAIRSRTKSVEKIIQKVHNKRNHKNPQKAKPNYEPESIRDIVGVRIVTLFREDMISVLKDMLKLIEHDSDGISPFTKDLVEEAIIYSPEVAGDTQAISNRVRAVLRSSGFEDVTHNEVMESMYSSIHLVVWCEVSHENKKSKVPVEIQIRTVFEDAWGEIDHKLRYKSDDIDENREAFPHLNVLKSFTDGCSKYADLIKLDCAEQTTIHVPRTMMRAKGAQDVLKLIGEIEPSVVQQIGEAYSAQSLAFKEVGKSRAPQFLDAAALFKNISINNPSLSENTGTLFNYYMTMERAFCYLESGDNGSLDKAVSIYLDMEKEYPTHPIITYRLAIALAAVQDEEEAIKALQRSKEKLDPNTDDNWLTFSVHRRLGFLHWQVCTKIDMSAEEKTNLLLLAYQETEKCLTYAGGAVDRKGALNNLVYFALDYFESEPSHRIKLPEVEEYFTEFEGIVNISTANIYQLDTLARVYLYQDNLSQAKIVARKIEELLRKSRGAPEEECEEISFDQVEESLSDSEKLILDRANFIIRKENTNDS